MLGIIWFGTCLAALIVLIVLSITRRLEENEFKNIEDRPKTLENWVASGGKFSSIEEAVKLTTNSSIGDSYVIKVEPGTYREDPFSHKSIEEK